MLEDRKLRTGIERVANWIIETTRPQGRDRRIALAHNKRFLCSRPGMTPESLSRRLATLVAHGISRARGEIIAIHREALERCVRPNLLIDG